MANSTKKMLEAMNNLALAITNANSAIEPEPLEQHNELDVPSLKLESAPISSPSMSETLKNCLNSNKKLEHSIK